MAGVYGFNQTRIKLMGVIFGYGGIIIGFAFVIYIVFRILEPIYLNLKEYQSLDNYFFKPLFFILRTLSYPIVAIGFLLSKIPEIFDSFTDFFGGIFLYFFSIIFKIIFFPIKLFFKFFDNTKTIDTELNKKSINNQVFKDEDPTPSGYKIAKAEQEIIEGKEVLDDWYKKPPVEPIDEEYEAEEYLKQKLEPENSEISNTLSQFTINPIDEEYEAEEYLKRKLDPDDGLDEEMPF